MGGFVSRGCFLETARVPWKEPGSGLAPCLAELLSGLRRLKCSTKGLASWAQAQGTLLRLHIACAQQLLPVGPACGVACGNILEFDDPFVTVYITCVTYCPTHRGSRSGPVAAQRNRVAAGAKNYPTLTLTLMLEFYSKQIL